MDEDVVIIVLFKVINSEQFYDSNANEVKGNQTEKSDEGVTQGESGVKSVVRGLGRCRSRIVPSVDV